MRELLRMQETSENGNWEIISLPRMRTIGKAYEETKTADPRSAITKNFIRKACEGGKVSAQKSGNRWLVDIDDLCRVLASSAILEKESFS